MYFCKQIYVRLQAALRAGKEEVDDIDGERIKMPKLKSRHMQSRHMQDRLDVMWAAYGRGQPRDMERITIKERLATVNLKGW